MSRVELLLLIDTAVPLAIAVVFVVLNTRGHKRARTELLFWAITAVYVAIVAAVAYSGAASVNHTHGYGVLGALMLALPLSLPGGILHQTFAVLFDVAADPAMTAVFALCLVCWALLNPLIARRIRQVVLRSRAARTAALSADGFSV
jgi:hypothetical protein